MRHWRSGILPGCVEWNKKLLSARRMESQLQVSYRLTREQYTTVISDEEALLELASCFLTGTGVSQPAIKCLMKTYQTTKSVKSAYKLALIYGSSANSNGLIDVDIVAAYEWYKAAAINGHVTSMAELALCYELGCGVERNDGGT